MEHRELLKQLPRQPGIYFMLDSKDTVIYVGKAKDLKARVSQYFHRSKNHSPKISEMIGHICTIRHITTDTELEALLLECATIRELKPKYNRLLKNYKNYKYIKLSMSEEYPKVSMVSLQKSDGSVYFGPYTSEGCVEAAVELIKEYYPIRKCSSPRLDKNASGCLHFHLGTCLGPCMSHDVKERYGKQVERIIQFLEGKDDTPLKALRQKMNAAVEALEFEKAAKYRDQIRCIRHVWNKQRLIQAASRERNIIAVQKCGEEIGKLFLIKGSRLLHAERFSLSVYGQVGLGERLRELAKDFFKPLEGREKAGLKQEELDEVQIIDSYLKNRSNGIQSVRIPTSRLKGMDYGKIAGALFE